MKWFKHYADASIDEKICELEDEFGYIGYGVYWKILETCALQWDGKTDPIFLLLLTHHKYIWGHNRAYHTNKKQ